MPLRLRLTVSPLPMGSPALQAKARSTSVSGTSASEDQELTMLAGHLRQALDLGIGPSPPMAESMYASKGLPLPSQPGLRRPNVDSLAAEALDQVEAAEALGDSDPPVAQSGKSSGSGYADVEKANMRTAMLSLSADIRAGGLAPECKAGWMRSAMLPLAPSPGAPEPLAAPAAQPTCGTQDSTTMTRPLIESLDKEDVEHLRRLRQFSDSDLRQLCAGEVAGKTARERAFIRSAMLPLSTGHGNGEVEGCFPVFVHIYDVTQEVGIRRLNKVLANKRLPVKFGGVFHAGVEVYFLGAGGLPDVPDMQGMNFREVQRWLCSERALAQKHFEDGIASKPPMGYNSWNDLECRPSEAKLKDKIEHVGLLALGYEYIVVDDCPFGCTAEPDVESPNSPAFPLSRYEVPPPVHVPNHIPRPSYADHPRGIPRALKPEEYAERKSPVMISKMRSACGLAAEALVVACDAAKEGVTTDEVDRKTSEFIVSRGGYPVGINYYGFPRGLCASPNEVALHGVPNTRPLENGDIVNFDVTVFLDGAYGDCSAMACIGELEHNAYCLVRDTRMCLEEVIKKVGPGIKLNQIGHWCQSLGKSKGLNTVREFCGHFIGSELHMQPNVSHVQNSLDLELLPGMTFTIEPIYIEGRDATIRPALEDGWTILTKRGDWAAQWEHTILITDHGAEILTQAL
ncbi:Methionine aminopeptidase 1 [Symbiodinium microadriaticum]|uniref:Methionine aminopeptidase n=1 Tax=Symbiodinium microadriaticum TaxID=2951 RepID=A0A1Q9EC10_SYMMI|nr:Methionine aminopeptidase 1 [Symbiodinium microadriaticum]